MQLAEVRVQAGVGLGSTHDQRVAVLLLGLLHLGQLRLDVGGVEREAKSLRRNRGLVVLERQGPGPDSVLRRVEIVEKVAEHPRGLRVIAVVARSYATRET